MSQENVEIVRHGYAAWNKGDVDMMLARFDADFEYVTSGPVIGLAPAYRGHEGWRDFWHDLRGT